MRFWSLTGLVPYERARELQLKLVELRARDQIPDTILFLEHEPVITRGRGLQHTGEERPRQMPLPARLPDGVSFSESERGGDLTYHGPGQLVVYPIVKLDGKGFAPLHDVSGFIRRFEQLLIDELADRGIRACARENATGVWIGDQKIASIGIAVRKWVVYHGLALNVLNDLSPFHSFSPCGFAPEVMTRLKDLAPLNDSSNNFWRESLELSLARRFDPNARPNARIEHLSFEQAFAQAMKDDPGLLLAQ